MNKILLTSLLAFGSLFAQDVGVECLVIKDENSIICKYTHERITVDKQVDFQWIDPAGNVSRERVMTIPSGHGSVYDFRYIQGRMLGTWTFKVLDQEKVYETTFDLQK